MAEFSSSVEIRATPDEVFEYLVTPAGLTAWMGQHAEVDPQPDGLFAVDIAGSAVRGRYLEVDRPRRVVVSWGMAGAAEFPPGASRVTFTLTPIPAGTRLDLVHSDLPDDRVAGHVDGWDHFLARLVAVGRGDVVADDDWIPLHRRAAGGDSV
jgi:uncharacterized protein YndB with AHSA1/START domain